MAVVGIDLGTTNTVVACVRDGEIRVIADEEGSPLLPSVVSFHPNGDVLVGREAKSRQLIDAKNTIASVKRLIGRPWDSDEMRVARAKFNFELREGLGQGALVVARGETYTLPEISAFVLKRVKQIAEAALGETVDKAVITVPAFFNELQRASTKVAGRVAGLEVLRILNEPTAAALAYGFGSERTERVVVYDFGGGTFDCSILDLTGTLYEVLATAGDTFLGGDDIDAAIADAMAAAFLAQHRYDPKSDTQVFERFRSAAEDLKKALSHDERAEAIVKDVVHGTDGRPINFTYAMTRADLEAIAKPFLDRTIAVTQDAMNIARLTTGAFDQIIVVGGSTRMPLVRKRVASFFNMKINDRVDPEEVVAIGAAVQAAALIDRTRGQSIPAAPTPGVIGKPQRLDAVPYAAAPRSSRPPAPVAARKTLRPGQAVPPPAEPQRTTNPGLDPFAAQPTAKRGNTLPGVRDDDPRSIATSNTLPRGDMMGVSGEMTAINPSELDLGATGEVRARTTPMAAPPRTDVNETRKRGGWAEMNPLETDDISMIGESPDQAAHAPRMSPQAGPASSSLGRGAGIGPLETDDISRIGASPMPVAHSAEKRPGGVSRNTLGGMANVGPLPTEDISILSYGEPRAFDPFADSPLPAAAPPAPFAPFDDFPPAPAFPSAPARQSQPPAFRPSEPPALRQSQPPAVAKSQPPPFPSRPPPDDFDNPSASGSLSSRISFDDAPQAPAARERAKAPLLIDVTPCTLVVETVGGFCDPIIPRNSMIPCDHTRMFATGRDLQASVQVRVAQGEEQRFDANQYLGEVEISNLRPAPRGEVLLSVTFELDVNGSLLVRAVDAATGRKAEASMKLITVTQAEDAIEKMVERSMGMAVKGRSS